MQLWLEELYKKMIKALSQIDCVNISTLSQSFLMCYQLVLQLEGGRWRQTISDTCYKQIIFSKVCLQSSDACY